MFASFDKQNPTHPKYHGHRTEVKQLLQEGVVIDGAIKQPEEVVDTGEAKSDFPQPVQKKRIVISYDRHFSAEIDAMAPDISSGRPRPIQPPHAWFHALDPDSYTLADNREDHGNFWPCRDISCQNYYRSYQTRRCPAGDIGLAPSRIENGHASP
jgi:hypothetical protein